MVVLVQHPAEGPLSVQGSHAQSLQEAVQSFEKIDHQRAGESHKMQQMPMQSWNTSIVVLALSTWRTGFTAEVFVAWCVEEPSSLL